MVFQLRYEEFYKEMCAGKLRGESLMQWWYQSAAVSIRPPEPDSPEFFAAHSWGC